MFSLLCTGVHVRLLHMRHLHGKLLCGIPYNDIRTGRIQCNNLGRNGPYAKCVPDVIGRTRLTAIPVRDIRTVRFLLREDQRVSVSTKQIL